MAVDGKPWALSDDGQIEYRLLTSKYLNSALDVMIIAFFVHENVCRAVNLKSEPNAVKELEELCIHAGKDGVSVVAIDKNSDKVVGVAFNKLQVKTSGEDEPYFEVFAKNCKYPQSRFVTEFMVKADGLCDLFELTHTDCLLEIMFLGTLPNYRGKGIGKRLVEISIEVAQQLKNGSNVKQSIDDDDNKRLALEPVPKVVSSICTSFITKKIVRQLGFSKAVERSFDMFEYNGRKLGECIEKETPTFTTDYKKL